MLVNFRFDGDGFRRALRTHVLPEYKTGRKTAVECMEWAKTHAKEYVSLVKTDEENK
jgi:hypothetical protein